MNKMIPIMNQKTLFLLVVTSSLLLSLGLPNEIFKQGSGFLTLLSLVPLYWASLHFKTWKEAGFYGALMMFIVHLCSSFWLANFKEFAIFTLGGSALATAVMGIPVGWFLKKIKELPRPIRPIYFASIWTIWEWGKSTGFLAYPWGTLPMGARSFTYLIQIADITGVWGISFLLALIAASTAEYITSITKKEQKEIKKSLVLSLSLLFFSCLYGFIALQTQNKSIDSAKLILVQHNADSWEQNGVKNALLIAQKLSKEGNTQAEGKADLIVWSESVLAYPYSQNRFWYEAQPTEDPFVPFLQEIGLPLLVGSPVLLDEEKGDYANAVIYLDPNGNQLEWYGKMQLVPFAEYMPFTEYQLVRQFFDSIIGFSSGWVPGTRHVTMPLRLQSGRLIQFVCPICFEDAFPQQVANLVRQGADLIINLTNDSWSKTESAEYQHFALASYRAIEMRRPLVRSTNAGYTAVIEPSGKVTADLPLFTPDVLTADIPIYPRSLTLYARLGDWFPLALGAFIFFLILFKKQGLDELEESC